MIDPNRNEALQEALDALGAGFINHILTEYWENPLNVGCLGRVRTFFDQSANRPALEYDREPTARIELDLVNNDLQYAFVLDGFQATGQRNWGSYFQTTGDMKVSVIGIGKKPELAWVMADLVGQTPGLRLENVDPNTLQVLANDWRLDPTGQRGIGPNISAWAVRITLRNYGA